MNPKPAFLGIQHASRFQDQSVVDRYHLRPTYPPETFDILTQLIVDEPRAILDAGCGPGELARYLVDFAERIDAVDMSLPMIEKGKTLPGGDSPKIRWLHGMIEDVPLAPPYALITAGQSLHWMDWDIVLPRFQQVLTPHGMLAILGPEEQPAPWDDPLLVIIKRYTTNKEYQPVDLIAEIEQRHLFQKEGEAHTAPISFEQPLSDFIEAYHAKSSLSRDYMTHEAANAFDEEVHAHLLPFTTYGRITVQVYARIVWGRPQNPQHMEGNRA